MNNDLGVASYFADTARRLLEATTVDDTLELIVHTAQEVVDGCDHVSVSHLRGKELVSRSSNDDIGPLLDAIQTEAQEGPCIDAIREGVVQRSDDLRIDAQWPSYGPMAVDQAGVISSLAMPLEFAGKTVGALDLFADRPGAFGERFEQHAFVAILVTHAAVALGSALAKSNLETALRSRDLVGQAKGILMVRGGVDEDRAFAQLSAASQRMNVKLTDLARRLVEGASGSGAKVVHPNE